MADSTKQTMFSSGGGRDVPGVRWDVGLCVIYGHCEIILTHRGHSSDLAFVRQDGNSALKARVKGPLLEMRNLCQVVNSFPSRET